MDTDWNASTADYVDVVLPHVPPTLISPEARRRIRAVAGQLPPCTLAGFECRLDGRDDQVDFQVGLARRPLARLGEAPAWHAIERLCADWAADRLPAIEAIALEFDVPEPVPSVFGRLVPDADLLRSTKALAGRPLSAACATTLGRLAWVLPDAASVRYVGVMLSRPSALVRVNVAGLDAAGLRALLASAGWPGPADEAARCMEDLAAQCEFVVACLDVDDGLLPRIGFECFLTPPRDFAAMLHTLTARGRCSPERRDELLAWCGDTPRPPIGPWPANLRALDALMGRGFESVFHRRISHLKVSYRPGAELEAKGYLVFSHAWRRAKTRG